MKKKIFYIVFVLLLNIIITPSVFADSTNQTVLNGNLKVLTNVAKKGEKVYVELENENYNKCEMYGTIKYGTDEIKVQILDLNTKPYFIIPQNVTENAIYKLVKYELIDNLLGDVNSDGKVDNEDCNLINRYLLGETLADLGIKEANVMDINKDTEININDLVLLKKIVSNGEQKKVYNNTSNLNEIKIEKKEEKIQVIYRTHVQDEGWQNWKKDGEMAGTSGKALRLEGINIKINNNDKIKVKYQTHIQDIGWQEWKYNGDMSGTSGKAKRLEGIKIELENSDLYSIAYRVHVQNIGWQEWKYDGDMAGTSGQSLRLEAIEIKLVEKRKKEIQINYQTHIQDVGWQDYKKDGTMSGTSGKGLRLEGIKIYTRNLPENVSLKYKTHVQNIGWQDWKNENEMSGTSGKSLRLEGIKIKLEGTDEYSVMYRTHVQNIGWQDWCYDGEVSGTEGEGLRLEAIQIKIVPKVNQKRVKIYLDNPTSTISNEKNNIKGWIMTSVKGVNLKIFIDGQEIDCKNLNREKRQDVLNRIKGYGDSEIYNSNPGFVLLYDFSKYNLGIHTIKIQAVYNNEIMQEISSEFRVSKKIEYSEGTYGVTGLGSINDYRGDYLKYYKYGCGPNVMFATFAIHGFEDLWAKDGYELVEIANNFKNELLTNNHYDLNEKWTIYIFPGVNIDGLKFGTTNNGPGRTTLISNGSKGVDLNRCWSTNFQANYSNRNYTGSEPFMACEARYLRDFMVKNKSKNGQTILVDLHGWTQQLIGDKDICNYYGKQFPENDRSSIERYGTGYLIGWARSTLGNNNKSAKAALIELPYEGVNSHQDVVKKNFSNRYINATLEMLKNL